MRLTACVDPSGGADMYGALDEYEGAADVILDFSHHTCTESLLEYATARHLPCVIATTGQSEAERGMIVSASSQIPIFMSANMSLGIAILARFARMATSLLPGAEVEIVEVHHDRKADAPSGTAILLADAAAESLPDSEPVYCRRGNKKRDRREIGIHSLRLGGVVGEHRVIIASGDEIISLSHTAVSRALYADGALTAAEFIVGKPAGIYDMNDIAGGISK